MRALLSPASIFLTHTLPALVLIFLLGSTIGVVHPLLDAGSIAAWWWAASALAVITIASAAYALVCWRMRRPLGLGYAVAVFLSTTVLLYLAYTHLDVLLPFELPLWMVSDDARFWPMRLLTPALAHAIMIMVVLSREEGEHRRPWLDALWAVAIPLTFWAAEAILQPMRVTPRGDVARHVFIVFMIVLVCVFLFFLLRAIYTMVLHRSSTSPWALLYKVPVAILLPVIGLLLNNGELPWAQDFSRHGPFGDLSHPMFYVVALLNGIVVCLPDDVPPKARLLLFLLRSVGYSYVLYFFILFLPLLPFSLAAIIGFGLGFLLLAPIMLFALQTTQLVRDAKFLAGHHPKSRLLGLCVAGVLVIPACITFRYISHRATLMSALDHVHRADLSSDDEADVDTLALARVLEQVDANRRGRRMDLFAARNTPFFTPYYNWLVLDNLTVSNDNVARLRRIFNLHDPGDRGRRRAPRAPQRGDVHLENIAAKATKDKHGTWRTWVELEITNHGRVQEEYATAFRLPPGCFIGGHYLWIDGHKEPGILAERKAAEWIYQRITRVERRDPSLLRHIGTDRYELLVFPVESGQTRRMGFEVLSKEAGIFSIDSMVVQLGEPLHSAPTTIQGADGWAFVPAHEKLRSPLVVRPSHRHFILDVSDGNGLDERMQRLAQAIIDPARTTIWITDASAKAVPATKDWRSIARDHEPSGGCFAGRAVQRILFEHMTQRLGERPLIIICAAELERVEFVVDMTYLDFAMPEEPIVYWQYADGSLHAAPLASPDRPDYAPTSIMPDVPVRAWGRHGASGNLPEAYLRNDSAASIFITNAHYSPHEEAGAYDDRWLNAQTMAGQWMQLQLHPEAGDAAWRDLVRASFRAQVLMPVTAYIAVENEAQKNALLKKQDEVLNADGALDASEDELQSMSEPGLLLLLIPFGLWVLLRRRTG